MEPHVLRVYGLIEAANAKSLQYDELLTYGEDHFYSEAENIEAFVRELELKKLIAENK